MYPGSGADTGQLISGKEFYMIRSGSRGGEYRAHLPPSKLYLPKLAYLMSREYQKYLVISILISDNETIIFCIGIVILHHHMPNLSYRLHMHFVHNIAASSAF